MPAESPAESEPAESEPAESEPAESELMDNTWIDKTYFTCPSARSVEYEKLSLNKYSIILYKIKIQLLSLFDYEKHLVMIYLGLWSAPT